MNFSDRQQAVRLALLGSIKEEVLPNDDLVRSLLGYLRKNYPSCLRARYGLNDLGLLDDDEVLSSIAQKRGLLLQGGASDMEKAALGLIRDFQDGAFGRLCLERP